MQVFTTACVLAFVLLSTEVCALSVKGLENLVSRRMPKHVDHIFFQLNQSSNLTSNATTGLTNDEYTVTCSNGTVSVGGNSLSGLAYGLHRYLADVVHADIYWYPGSQLEEITELPACEPMKGSSIVPYRYHFNTVTFSYTAAFWSWEDWELELDWLALRGVNLPLAWVGIEKILLELFQEIGLSNPDIFDFFSGPAFQSWNRFGNIQGSWGGFDLPMAWIEDQFRLQQKIIPRMLELGMTPVLPAFTGFVPRTLPDLFPNASIFIGSQWNGFQPRYTNDTFLQPSDPLFSTLQTRFIQKQKGYYGGDNISHIYTLDQFNENDPTSGDLDDLRNLTYNNWQSLKAADSDAIWMLQGWLFYSSSDFWTNERVEAYLSGVTNNSDMLILDLFSESQPQWQRLNSYYGKPWIWCQLHDYGGNHGLYGQVLNVTINPIEALANSSSLVGFGLTMEGQEGNEIMYDLLLDQAWSESPIDTPGYFYDWATTRYSSSPEAQLPSEIYEAWSILLDTAYNNTNLTGATAVSKSIMELAPNATGLLGRTSHHATTINYPTQSLVEAWKLFRSAADRDSSLWLSSAYQFDLVDITRQVLANAFNPLYSTFVSQISLASSNMTALSSANRTSTEILSLLTSLDAVLLCNPSTSPAASLPNWVSAALSFTSNSSNSSDHDIYAYNAVNQVTLWGPTGEITDYASKSWGGLVGTYYKERWNIWTGAYLQGLSTGSPVNQTDLRAELLEWEENWQTSSLMTDFSKSNCQDGLQAVVQGVVEQWGWLLES